MMKNMNLVYLALAVFIASLASLINRLWMPIPKWLAIIVTLVSVVFIVLGIIKSFHRVR